MIRTKCNDDDDDDNHDDNNRDDDSHDDDNDDNIVSFICYNQQSTCLKQCKSKYLISLLEEHFQII